eukprot:4213660-Pyramimonas_sp.AAC.2
MCVCICLKLKRVPCSELPLDLTEVFGAPNRAADNGKYALAARLGDAVTIKSKLLDITAETTKWEQSAVLTGSGKLLVSAEIETGFTKPDGTL